jgi:hypothetical protein
MAQRDICCFKGRGKISLAGYDDYAAKLAGLIFAGNAPQLEVTVSEKTESIADYTSAAGGEDCVSREIEKVEITLTLQCHSVLNLATHLYGTGALANVASAAVIAEPHVAWPGATVPLDGVPDPKIAIVVKGTGDGVATPYVEGTDYRITDAGSIEILAGTTIPAPTIAAGVGQANITVGYTKAEQSVVQLFNRISAEQVLHFDGVNIMSGGKPFQFNLYRVKFSPAKTFSLVSDNAGKLELTGAVQRDPRKSVGTFANPFSQYGTLTLS